MKEYCVDLEIAKELKENGFCINNMWYWYRIKNSDMTWHIIGNGNTKYEGKSVCFCPNKNDLLYSAPTTDEILKELPKVIDIDGYSYTLNFCLSRLSYSLNYENYKRESFMGLRCIDNEKLPNALAKIWLYLKKEGYITCQV